MIALNSMTAKQLRDECDKEIKDRLSRFKYIKKLNVLRIDSRPGNYEVDIDTINDQMQLLKWVIHLSEKNWMDSRMIIFFICHVCEIKEWDLNYHTKIMNGMK